MITDKIKSVLEDCLTTPFDYIKIHGLEFCAEEIVKLITPKLDWLHLYENVWIGRTPFMYNFTLHLEDNGLWKIHKYDYENTLEESKKECEKLFMEMYLNTCK